MPVSGSYVTVPPSADAADLPSASTPVATLANCEPLIASVEVDEITPGATLVIWRSLPARPTDTTAVAGVPAAVPPYIAYVPVLGAAVTELEPSATSLALLAVLAIIAYFLPNQKTVKAVHKKAG